MKIASLSLAALAAGLIVGCATSGPNRTPGDVTIDDRDVYPESVTSTRDGTLITGSLKGIVFRAAPDSLTATAWIRPDEANGLAAIFGVLADEKSNTLWLCNGPNPFKPPVPGKVSELLQFDLTTGRLKSRHPFPPPSSTCNDVTIAADGSAYAADTPNGRIFKLARGAKDLTLFGEAESLKGIDGIAFASDGTLYVNIVSRGALMRIGFGADRRMSTATELRIGEKLGGPDGMRLIDGHRFLLAEGTTGRISEVRFEGDAATLRPLRTGLNSSPGVTLVGDTAYATEGKIGYLVDPKLRGQDPGPFRIIAIPLK
jgi:hypothetical protein